MRSRTRRRSISSFCSPGPRPPMPPSSRDRPESPRLISRGSRYFSWASSTWILPSWVRARRAKMSRISCERSITLRSVASAMARAWAGVRFWSTTMKSACSRSAWMIRSCSLPEPISVRGSNDCAALHDRARRPRRSLDAASSASSSIDASAAARLPGRDVDQDRPADLAGDLGPLAGGGRTPARARGSARGSRRRSGWPGAAGTGGSARRRT